MRTKMSTIGGLKHRVAQARSCSCCGRGLCIVCVARSTDKAAVGRTRPDESDNKSFPSGHSSIAFAGAGLSNRNLDSIDIKPWMRNSLKAVNLGAASATAWARVEAAHHFPADVLAGAALGNFITTFMHDAFMNMPENAGMDLYVEPSLSGVTAALKWSF